MISKVAALAAVVSAAHTHALREALAQANRDPSSSTRTGSSFTPLTDMSTVTPATSGMPRSALPMRSVLRHAVLMGEFSTNIGSRLYLLESESKYQGFTLLGNEFTFDVDVSNLDCGLNGALYFSSMDLDGGVGKFPSNTASPKYGTGYCDSQCPRDVKLIDGEANVEGWAASSNDANAGIGNLGACCAEMDIQKANKIAIA
ncbi:hypothetical protein V501_07964 [Pseudogymnoascus sp. VKM F-4519 (FW-2642)]|nr:hypothetical protein V501_07964 [Pseudogymnoascus sp. VKM F-4519 (FW-2642)]